MLFNIDGDYYFIDQSHVATTADIFIKKRLLYKMACLRIECNCYNLYLFRQKSL